MFKRILDVSLTMLIVVALAICGSPVSYGQASTATVSGVIADSASARIPKAQIHLVNTATGRDSNSETNDQGLFAVPGLLPGIYTLQVEADGFATAQIRDIALHVGDNRNLMIRLKLGVAVENVTVEAGTETVNTTDATVNTVVQEKYLENLPMNGRNAAALLMLAPGTVDVGRNVSPIASQGGLYPGEQTASVNGSTRTQVNYQMDGVSHNDTYLNASLPFPNPDAIQEFALQSANFSAEYGNAAGGVVNIVAKSGTNQFHGSAFEFFRNGSLNAKNFFGSTQDTLRRNQFGGTFGGPILKNKLFFFATYQGTRLSSASAAGVAFVPTAAQRNGDFSGLSTQLRDPVTGAIVPGNRIPVSRINPVAQYILQTIPLPNGANGQLTYRGAPQRSTDDQAMGKIDYSLGKHLLSGHYFYTRYNQPPVKATDNLLTAIYANSKVTVQTISVSDTWTFSPTLQFSTTFGLNMQKGGSGSSAPFGYADAGSRIAQPTPPELILNITSGFSLATNHLGDFNRGDLSVRESVTKTSGRHEMHIGGQALRVNNNIVNTYRQAGTFTFNGQLTGNGIADFIYGRAQSFSQGGGEYKNFAGVQWSLFFQDNWRVNTRLTLNAGLRWDPWLPYYDRDGRVVCYVPGARSIRYPNAPVGLVFGGTNADPGCPTAGSKAYWSQLGPRFGFAYRLTDDGKTTVRGGFGMYYTPLETTDYNGMSNTAPFSPQYTYNNVDLSDPYGSVGLPNPFPSQYGPATPSASVAFTTPVQIRGSFARDFRPPTTQSWNLIVERELDRSSFVRLSYVGNRSYHLSEATTRELNPAVYIPGSSTTGNTNARRLNTTFQSIAQLQSASNSNYNSLQTAYEKRMRRGVMLMANYTWGKSLDDLGWTSPYTRSFDYGRSSWDISHNFKFSTVWDVPGVKAGNEIVKRLTNGWRMNGIWTWQNGFPLTVLSGTDLSYTGVGRDHANYLGGAVDLSGDRTHREMTSRWFNTGTFAANTAGTFGTSPKGQFRGPRYFNVDYSVVKDTRITEKVNFQLRGEFFNLMNNVNLTSPNVTFSSAQFGQITTALDPRILQLSAKVTF